MADEDLRTGPRLPFFARPSLDFESKVAPLDIDRLSAPFAGDNPCGIDVEYESDFMELVHLEQRISKLAAERSAVPLEWRTLQERAEALLLRSKDLRVALCWLRAAIRCQGICGLHAGLSLVDSLLRTFGDGIHPQPVEGDTSARSSALFVLRSAELADDLAQSRIASDSEITGHDLLEVVGRTQGGADVDVERDAGLLRQIEMAILRRPALLACMLDVHQVLCRVLSWIGGPLVDRWGYEEPAALVRFTVAAGRLARATEAAGRLSPDETPGTETGPNRNLAR